MDRRRPTNLDAVLSSITEHWSPGALTAERRVF